MINKNHFINILKARWINKYRISKFLENFQARIIVCIVSIKFSILDNFTTPVINGLHGTKADLSIFLLSVIEVSGERWILVIISLIRSEPNKMPISRGESFACLRLATAISVIGKRRRVAMPFLRAFHSQEKGTKSIWKPGLRQYSVQLSSTALQELHARR